MDARQLRLKLSFCTTTNNVTTTCPVASCAPSCRPVMMQWRGVTAWPPAQAAYQVLHVSTSAHHICIIYIPDKKIKNMRSAKGEPFYCNFKRGHERRFTLRRCKASDHVQDLDPSWPGVVRIDETFVCFRTHAAPYLSCPSTAGVTVHVKNNTL